MDVIVHADGDLAVPMRHVEARGVPRRDLGLDTGRRVRSRGRCSRRPRTARQGAARMHAGREEDQRAGIVAVRQGARLADPPENGVSGQRRQPSGGRLRPPQPMVRTSGRAANGSAGRWRSQKVPAGSVDDRTEEIHRERAAAETEETATADDGACLLDDVLSAHLGVTQGLTVHAPAVGSGRREHSGERSPRRAPRPSASARPWARRMSRCRCPWPDRRAALPA
jgi:hypothetical protein